MKWTILFVALTTLVVQYTTAFRVETTDVAPPADILGEHQEFEKTWTVYNAHAVEKLTLDVPGPVFVYYDASLRSATPSNGAETSWNASSSSPVQALTTEDKVVAKLVVTGNAAALMNLYQVLPLKHSGSNDGLHVHLTNTDATASGNVLTYLYVADPALVRTLTTLLPSMVVVGTNVLLRNSTTSKLKLSNSGAGSLFIEEDAPVDIKSINIDLAGSGLVQLNLSALTAHNKMSTSIAGSGIVALHTTALTTPKLVTSSSGSGSHFVVAKTLETTKITTSVYGSSMVSFAVSEAGTTDKQALTVAGSGSIYAGSIVAHTTSVDLWGSGVVYVRVLDQLSVSTLSGDVFYVGEKPRKIASNKWFFWTNPVKPATDNKLVNYTLVATPTPYPELVSVTLKHNTFFTDPVIWTHDDPTMIQHVVMHAKMTSMVRGPHGFLVYGGIGFAVVVVAMVARGYQQRRLRRQYMPLV